MANKILKKIAGALDYKLVEKNLIKNNRLVNSKSILNLNLILKKIFDSQRIKCLIQIGANDGNRFDELNKFIKEHKIKSILVEPINEYFEDLKRNYQNFENVYFENSAITVAAKEKEIFAVNNNNLKDYDEHIKGINSFDKNHLIKHGVKSKHIIKKKINCISILNLLEKYNISNLDILFVDAEGYDGDILLDFLSNSKQEPILIFEYIHVKNKILKDLIDKITKKNYSYFNINENLICLPKKIEKFL
jgi:FkbM family methyltransferase